MEQVIHIKSGKTYSIITRDVINATNKDDGTLMVVYVGSCRGNVTIIFTREQKEFDDKFKLK